MTDPMLTAGVERIAQERYPHDWQDRVLVANIASILHNRGFSTVQDVRPAALDDLFNDNTFAAACDCEDYL
ncbi:hypothetical protein ACWGLC_17550 [Dietzia sp. NPDC055877]